MFQPFFSDVEFSEDPDTLRRWVPLMMEGRDSSTVAAATRNRNGTDVNFGELARQQTKALAAGHATVLTSHKVTDLRHLPDGRWLVSVRSGREIAETIAKFVFIGAGGASLELFQKAKEPKVDNIGVLPVGAIFLACSDPDVVNRHEVKAYAQAEPGAPSLSIPHLDRRMVDGTPHLLFGPYATMTSRLLKTGSLTDAFRAVTRTNFAEDVVALSKNLGLVSFFFKQLIEPPSRRFNALHRLYPNANPEQWRVNHAGVRGQLVLRGENGPELRLAGTEVIVSDDGSLAGLLGASPGASTAVFAMLDVLRQAFPSEWTGGWEKRLKEAIPALAQPQWNAEAVNQIIHSTRDALGLE